MTLAIPDALSLILLTAGYWAVDRLIRRDGFLHLLRRLGFAQNWLGATLWVGACAVLASFWRWQHLFPSGSAAEGQPAEAPTALTAIRFLAGVLVALLAWQAATRDIDPVTGEAHTLPRLLVLVCAVGTWFSPACLLAAAFLFTTPFALWQHHATLPMRLVLALSAYAGLSSTLFAIHPSSALFRDAAVPVFFILTLLISHYLITALAKSLLGPRWYSWVTDNRLHHLAASAYSWGWARFLPWEVWLRVIKALKRVEKPLQAGAYGIELLAPLALLHPHAAIAFCLAWAAFHLGCFTCAGLLFWDWILAELAVAASIALLPASVTERVFGPWSVAASLIFMAVFPLRHKLWKPMPLGWFDTPFTQRIHWRVRGVSGKLYGLYNDFMCPHERLYGKVHGCFLAPVPVITYHLGEVWKHDLRDAIRHAGPDRERLDAVRERFGIVPVCKDRAANHQAYLRRFFHELNRGAPKHVLPSGLRWLKAPGDQIFYWGELPAYKGQEKVAGVSLHYREEYFDGEALRRLRDEPVLEFPIDDAEPPPAAREPTPKEIDDFLLGFAAGKLIDLPGFRGGYVQGDDGKPAPQRPEPGRHQSRKRSRSAGEGSRQVSRFPNQR